MNVGTPSDGHSVRSDDWATMRAFVAGRKAVLEGEAYLARLHGQDDESYKSYKARSYFLNATQRSVDGMVGLLFRKAPATEWSAGFEPYANDISRGGQSAAQFAEEIANEVMTTGLCGVLVDHPPQETPGVIAQARELGMRPYARLYTAESILDVREAVRGADRILSQVRLLEVSNEPDPDDEFGEIKKERVRVLALDDAGYYFVRLYEKMEGKGGASDWVMVQEPSYPLKNGQRMTEVPFRLFTKRGHDATYPKPPLLDLAQSNCGHLNDSALYQWGLMWTANPTPCFINLSLDEGENVALGSSKGLLFGEGGNAFFLEFGGQGLAAVRQAMEDKRRDMATLGARMLMEDRKQVEAAETAQIHRSGENSILAAIAASVSEGMEWVLASIADWANVTTEISFKINQDFVAVAMDGPTLTALVGAWQGGALTMGDLFRTLQRGEVIADDKTLQTHEEELEAETPVLPVADAA